MIMNNIVRLLMLKGEKGDKGAGGVWGEIEGTLSSQTDLQQALNAKANNAEVQEALNGKVSTTIFEQAIATKADKTDVYTKTETNTLLSDKVDKVSGKGLSTNDFTDALKAKVESLGTYSTDAKYVSFSDDVRGGVSIAFLPNNHCLVSMSLFVAANTETDNSDFISIDTIKTAFGLTDLFFLTQPNTSTSGVWWSDSNSATSMYGSTLGYHQAAIGFAKWLVPMTYAANGSRVSCHKSDFSEKHLYITGVLCEYIS